MRHHFALLDSTFPDPGTVLVFGGVTLEGFENARRLAEHWTTLDRRVVWFDGVPVDKPAHPPTDGLFVVDYGARERNRRLNRLERKRVVTAASVGDDRSNPGTGARAELGPPGAKTTLPASADRFLARVLKRWNTATRGYASWRLIRGDVLALSNRLTPAEIFYCDDHALTAAWHAARLWPETPVARAPNS